MFIKINLEKGLNTVAVNILYISNVNSIEIRKNQGNFTIKGIFFVFIKKGCC